MVRKPNHGNGAKSLPATYANKYSRGIRQAGQAISMGKVGQQIAKVNSYLIYGSREKLKQMSQYPLTIIIMTNTWHYFLLLQSEDLALSEEGKREETNFCCLCVLDVIFVHVSVYILYQCMLVLCTYVWVWEIQANWFGGMSEFAKLQGKGEQKKRKGKRKKE